MDDIKPSDIKVNMRPEWLRIPDATKLFGVSRSLLYELMHARRIRSFALRRPGKIKGIRLISYESLREYLEAQANKEEELIPDRQNGNFTPGVSNWSVPQ
jgi:predicted DNA-binding transcriptional regulator AlpA